MDALWPRTLFGIARVVAGSTQPRCRSRWPLFRKQGSQPISRRSAKPVSTFSGPLYVKHGRGTAKRWGCLFTCLATRAVHLEVAPSLETDDTIMVLRQFLNRRGPPDVIFSDNGTNFVGAVRELRDAQAQWRLQQIEERLQQDNIKWVFQPPAAPHMSGVWKRLVKMAKRHLSALIGSGLVSDFELRTLFAEVEGIVNSRPITPVSSDPQDLEALTPNHLLLQRKVSRLPLGIFVKEACLRRRRWRKVQFLADCFWKRWLREFLPGLQPRQRNLRATQNVKVGSLVLVVDEQPR